MVDDIISDETLSTYLANEFVSLANSKLNAGLIEQAIAEALCHAAANFTAYINSNNKDHNNQTELLVQEFKQLLDHYFELHQENSNVE